MKILKFNESKDNHLLVISDCFSPLSEELDNICSVSIVKTMEDSFKIKVKPIEQVWKKKSINGEKDFNLFNDWEKNIESHMIILKTLKRCMDMICDESIVEHFTLKENMMSYDIEIQTKLVGEISEWVFINPSDMTSMCPDTGEITGAATFNKFRLKKILEDKFGVDVKDSGRYEIVEVDETYEEFRIFFKNKIGRDIRKKIIDFILKTEITTEDDGTFFVFERLLFESDNLLKFEVSYSISGNY